MAIVHIFFGPVNVAMFDWPWSVIHLMSGTVIGLILVAIIKYRRVRFWLLGVGLLLLWEIFERLMHYLDLHHHAAIAAFKASIMGFAFAPEKLLNTTGDMVIGSLGLWLGLWLARRLLRIRTPHT